MRNTLRSVLAAVFCLSACAWLQPPFDVRMEALNTRYTLHWDWLSSGHKHTGCFIVQYIYSHQHVWNSSVRDGVCEQSCDLSGVLSFSASYRIRVRAESGGQRSNWSHTLNFTPDEDTLLGQPSSVELQGGVSMVMVQMLEPLTHDDKPMSNMMGELSYRAQYWERDTPGQICEVDTHIPLLLLQELKPYTEYCLRVCVFSLDYNKISNYTHTQCTHTHGQCPVWHVPLGVCAGVCVLVLATLTLLLRKKMGKSPPKYLTPCSLQGPPLSHLHLLHLDQEHCSRAALETAVALTTRGEDSGCGEEMRGVCGEERRGVCEDSGCAEEKSGVCEDSGCGEEMRGVCEDSGRGEERSGVCEDSGCGEERKGVCEDSGCGEERRGVCEDSGWYSGEDNSGTSISSQLHKHTHTLTHSHSHCCHGNSTLGTQACLVFQNSQMEPTLKCTQLTQHCLLPVCVEP